MCRDFFKILVLMATVSILPFSCASPEAGLGPALDLEGPVVTVTSPKNLDFVFRSFTLAGECRDNTGVVSVDILNKNTGAITTATLSGDRRTWSAFITLPVDGPFEFDITAHDKAQNSSSKSIATISVTVDSQSPSAFVFQPVLKKADYWTTLWEGSERTFEDIDFFQNGTITIKGNLDDNYQPKSLKVELLGGNMYSTVEHSWTMISGQPFPLGASGTIYSWAYSLDTTTLTWNSAPIQSNQRYIYKVRLTAKDATDNEFILDPPATSPGYLMVYQNADLPWSKVTSAQEWNQVPPGGILSGNVYDDDGVKDFYVKILPNGSPAPGATDYLTWTTDLTPPDSQTLVIKSSSPSSPLADKPRQYTWTLKVPMNAGQYVAYIMPVDKADVIPGSYQEFNFFVPDVNAPSVEITTNEVLTQKPWPEDGFSDFSIDGQTQDNSGTSEVRLAWVPNGVDFAPLFDSATRGAYWVDPIGSKFTGPTGIVVWPITLGSQTTTPEGKKQNLWTKAFVFNTDFQVGGTPQYLDRNLVLYAKDGEGNITYARYVLLGAKTPPTITCTSPNTPNAPYANSFTGDYFNLGGTYSTSTKISSIKVSTNLGGTLTSKTVTTINPVAKTWEISSFEFAPLPNGPANFEITITDVYGNKGYASKFVIVDTGAPAVVSVTTSMPTGTYVKAGDTVPIQVKFSEPVTVTGASDLSMNSGPAKAIYSNGSGSDTLTYYYNLPPGSSMDNTAALDYLNTSALGTSGTIKDSAGNSASLTLSAPGSANSLRQGGAKTIIVDTTVPAAPVISGTVAGGYNTSKSFTVAGEALATLEYSLDNGNTWTVGNARTITLDGIYNITARQTDLAGNRSANASVIAITIDQAGPAAPFISGITVGTFKTDQTFTIYGEAGATLEYTLNGGTNWIVGSTLTLSADGTYNIKARQTDAGGNQGSETPQINLTIDKTAPAISSLSPLNNTTNFGAALGFQNTDNSKVPSVTTTSATLSITFDENIFKEAGTVTLNPETSYVPFILSVDDYNKYYSYLAGNVTDQGRIQNAYQLTANGADASGVTETRGAYVLDYDIAPGYASGTSTTTGLALPSWAQLQAIFSSLNYRKITIDIQSPQISIVGRS